VQHALLLPAVPGRCNDKSFYLTITNKYAFFIKSTCDYAH